MLALSTIGTLYFFVDLFQVFCENADIMNEFLAQIRPLKLWPDIKRIKKISPLLSRAK